MKDEPQPLYLQMSRHFNLGDLRILCHEMHINYDNLGGNTLDLKLVALVEYCQNYTRMDELLKSLRSSRPGVPWDDCREFNNRFELEIKKQADPQDLSVLITESNDLSIVYDSLDEETRQVFRSLAIFPGEFSAAAESYICDDKKSAQLKILVNENLVGLLENQRFELEQAVKDFARVRLRDERVEHKDIQERFIGHYLDFAEQRKKPKPLNVDELESELNNLNYARSLLRGPDNLKEGVRFVDALIDFSEVKGYWREESERIESLLGILQRVSKEGENSIERAILELANGRMLYRMGEYPEAKKILEANYIRCLNIVHDRINQIKFLSAYNWGLVLVDGLREYKEFLFRFSGVDSESVVELGDTVGLEHVVDLEELAKNVKDDRAVIMTKQQFGKVYYFLGSFDKAEEYLQFCLNLIKTYTGDLAIDRFKAYTLYYLGVIYHTQKDFDLAQIKYIEGLKANEHLEEFGLELNLLLNLAELYCDLKLVEEAQDKLKEIDYLRRKAPEIVNEKFIEYLKGVQKRVDNKCKK